jgi:hypothetical protein
VALAFASAVVEPSENTLGYLEQALAEAKPALTWAIRFPIWDAILHDPRYTAVVTGMTYEPWDLSSPS